ncbi:hypothetical protein V9T40_004981 [Parthenolecanium corni]|uniref:Serine protease K12H4.7 n=1 Tax=Parthenolecanium corni TaxID=536013 RepID=A0AAN9THB5_9HEMI
MHVTFWFMHFLFGISLSQKIRNYYLGVEDPGLGKSHVDTPKEQFFSQKLNHFDPTDHTTWLQRYWVNKSKYAENGPVFLMINGEAPASPIWMSSGAWLDYGKELNAMYILLEHRYYGSSRPTNDTSTKSLVYLNTQQALADVAYFIDGMKQKYNLSEDTKWIALGGSYAGALAAWMRYKYPHLVYGAVSSSGPLLAKMDYKEYFHVVHHSISSYSNKCEKEISRANKQLEIMIKTKRGRLFLTEWFNLCEELSDNEYDISFLFLTFAYNFANLVQYDKGYKSATGLNTIRGVCNLFLTGSSNNKTSSLRRYAEVNKLLLNASDGECISSVYETYIEKLRETDWDTSSTYGRQWMYQTCTEFGFYQTSSTEKDTFGTRLPIEFFSKQCEDIFGSEFNDTFIRQAINETNLVFGGYDINIDRVVFTHGTVDPWYPLGLYHPSDKKNYDTIFIKGTSHCSDLNQPTDKDSVELKNARRAVRNIILSWFKKQ